MEWKIKRFCIANAIQIKLDILLDYSMLQSYFHMKLMVCSPLPWRRDIFQQSRKGNGVPWRMLCRVWFQREALSADFHWLWKRKGEELIIKVSWSQWKPALLQSSVAHDCTSLCVWSTASETLTVFRAEPLIPPQIMNSWHLFTLFFKC